MRGIRRVGENVVRKGEVQMLERRVERLSGNWTGE